MTRREPGVAILGASGYIGQHFARLLHRHPVFGRPLLVGTERSAGRRLDEVWVLGEAPPDELAGERFRSVTPATLERLGVRLAFGALPSGAAGPVEDACRRRGISVFTNAADHRMDAGVPLLIPEVNGEHLRLLGSPGPHRKRALLVANPNCTTTGLVLGLAPVLGLLQPRTVHVTSYQALSGAGLPGLGALATSGNVLPHIPMEEEKIAREAPRILGTVGPTGIRPRTLWVLANCARVPVLDGHLEAVTVEARRRPTSQALLDAWGAFDPLAGRAMPSAPHPAVELRREPDRPQPRRDLWAGRPTRARGMAAVVGRPRWSPPFLRFFVLSHNAVRGGAGGSVLNAEYALDEGYLPEFGPGATG